jgi:D-amino-acid dehydrogenase
METGIRLTSQVEFAGLTAAPDYRRVRSLLPAAKRMLPGLDNRETSVWMGRRPSLPDSLPVLGFSSRSKRVLYAFGHQHLGMTMAAITGLVMADVLAGRKPVVDPTPYGPGRF